MNTITRNPVPVLVVLVLALAAAGAFVAAESGSKQAPAPVESRAYLNSYYVPSSGVALDGYDAVSYLDAKKAVRGTPAYVATHNGVTYQFASAANRRAFDRDPARYLPAYGGWCAFGMAVEQKFPVDPTAFKIVDGRLLLFLRNKNIDALKLWNGNDEKAQLAKANAHWAKLTR